MRRATRIEPRRPKLPPILEVDEDGVLVNEMEPWDRRPMWRADEDVSGVSLGEWPTEFDD